MLEPETQNSIDMNSGIASVLGSLGIGKTPEEKLESEKNLNHIQKIFNDAGAGVEDAAIKIAGLMESNKGEIALRACETALKVQGVFNDKDKGKMNPTVTINVVNAFGGEGKALVNLIMPAAL